MIFGWTQDDGAMNAGPGHLIQREEDMVESLKKFSQALTADHLSKIFSLYPVTSFQQELSNYQARKTAQGPEISVHFFRLSRILRDLLFTCSSINYGYEMAKQTRTTINPDFNAAWLYSLNQSVLTPIFQGAGMPYIGVAHGSDTNYIFNGVFPEGDMSKEDKALSERLSRSLINFAYTGKPISNTKTGKQFEAWLEAFGNGIEIPNLDSFNLQVIGGPFGTGSVVVTNENGDEDTGYIGADLDPQNILKYGSFESSTSSHEAVRLVIEENLFERCAYIESLSETLGV